MPASSYETMPFGAAVKLIEEGAGRHFDPDVVEAFLASLDAFRDILNRHADTEESLERKLEGMRARGMV